MIRRSKLAIFCGKLLTHRERNGPMGRAGAYTALRGRIGGLTRSATSDMREFAASGAEGLLRRFEREADPDGVLEPRERHRRAIALRRLHFAKLALASAKARRRRAEVAS